MTPTTHTQINTCPRCHKVDKWEVEEYIPIHDEHNVCFACIQYELSTSSEPMDASGYADESREADYWGE